jgi:hypothetical protein
MLLVLTVRQLVLLLSSIDYIDKLQKGILSIPITIPRFCYVCRGLLGEVCMLPSLEYATCRQFLAI